MSEFSDYEKVVCLERELALRRRVYAQRMHKGLMGAAQAQREIALVEAILADYRARAQPRLLEPTP